MSLQKLLISLAHLLLILCHDCMVESRVVSKTGLLASSSATSATCTNCTFCQYPCRTLPPPAPPQGYPLYGAPPTPPITGYPVLGPPPPPAVQGNCPPGQVACCQYAPPIPYGYGPPNPYGYVPVVNHSAALAFFPSLLCWIVVVLFFVHN